MKSLFLAIFTVLNIYLSVGFPQKPKWINLYKSDVVQSIAREGNFMWVGTNKCLFQFDNNTGKRRLF